MNYWTAIAPFIILMAFGMGLVFVTMTLVAVHGIPSEESGIGSGVLNTMQQVGGAIGLAALSTVVPHFSTNRGEEIGGAIQAASGSGAAPSPTPPTASTPSSARPPSPRARPTPSSSAPS